MTQRRRRRSFSRRPRRTVEWHNTNLNQLLTSGSQISLELSAGIAQDEVKGMTVMRVIVDLVAQLSVAGTGGLVSMGIAMVAEEAVTAGGIPDTNVEANEASWMWLRALQTVSATNLSDRSSFTPFLYDSKVMRRFRFEELQLRWICNAGTLSANVNINGSIRVLVAKT